MDPKPITLFMPIRAPLCQGGERALVLGVDDQLLAASPHRQPAPIL